MSFVGCWLVSCFGVDCSFLIVVECSLFLRWLVFVVWCLLIDVVCCVLFVLCTYVCNSCCVLFGVDRICLRVALFHCYASFIVFQLVICPLYPSSCHS